MVNHPVRRRIVMWLMLAGNAGIVAAVGSGLLTFIEVGESPNWPLRFAVLGLGLAVLWLLATSRYVDRLVSHLTTRALRRWTTIDVGDYAELLHLGGDYKVLVVPVDEGDALANRSLAELNLRQRGMLTLAVERRDGTFIGVPPLELRIEPGDQVTIYGRVRAVEELARRPG